MNNSNTNSNTTSSAVKVFADCALIEIIHLHDCLRGALVQIRKDVQILVDSSLTINNSKVTRTNSNNNNTNNNNNNNNNSTAQQQKHSHHEMNTLDFNLKNFNVDKAADLSNSVASRFHLIFSVFQAHSAAEDEFIWPALNMKIESKKSNNNTNYHINNSRNTNFNSTTDFNQKCGCESIIEPEEYQEDHVIEENMFKQIQTTLRRLNGSFRYYHYHKDKNKINNSNSNASNSSRSTSINTDELSCLTIIRNVILQLKEQTDNLSQHLLQHLQKEETQCLPMVQRHLSKDEISTLVGKIMGQRSAEIMAKILNLAVCSLPLDERQDMVDHMKKAMTGTFFEKWLVTGGWLDDNNMNNNSHYMTHNTITTTTAAASTDNIVKNNNKKMSQQQRDSDRKTSNSTTYNNTSLSSISIRTSATSTKRKLSNGNDLLLCDTHDQKPPTKKVATYHHDSRLRHPSRYYIQQNSNINNKNHNMNDNKDDDCTTSTDSSKNRNSSSCCTSGVSLIWDSCSSNNKKNDDAESKTPTAISTSTTTSMIPQFSISELTPTYHFNEKTGGLVLGCEHYMRECKLRHPITGELFTCRLCCEEVRQSRSRISYTNTYGGREEEELPQLDRYNVTEVLCMKCGSLQPASKSCVNKNCESHGKQFATYYCSICHLYDDSKTSIYHCPYCNVCRKGEGLGIDFRHCMRCNACVSISEKHKCIPQRLQGNCPICHETMFESTEPLRGLKCGHVMHLSCFNDYQSRATLGKLTCPFCKQSFENMRG